MSEFKNATIVKEANIYFDGKVTSRTVITKEGERVTLGIMLPGDYNFGTGAEETMEILAGDLEVLIPGESEWKTITAGQSFVVPGNSRYDIKIKSVVDYVCHYAA